MTDQNRKTLRSFYCRDYLWELFEQMTHDLGCSMDYLINESMRMYARSRDYAPGDAPDPGYAPPPQPGGGYQPGPQFGGQPMGAMNHQTFDRIPPVANQRQPSVGAGYGARTNPPPPPAPQQPSGGWSPPAQPQPPQGGYGYNGQQPPPQAAAQPPLYLIFNNNRYVIDKEKYVIGRGSQNTDLTIRDGNISRKHCAVIYRNGAYYIKDMDSTNGIEYRGDRIESKKVEENDVFYLCDYELRFTYRP